MTPIPQLHAEYCRLTGFKLTLDYNRERVWYEWQQYRKEEPFTLSDLADLIKFLKAQIRAGKRYPGCLKFRNIIERPDWCEEELQEARAEARQKRPVDRGRAEVLKATGRVQTGPERPTASAEHVAEVVQRSLAEIRRAIG